MENFKRSIISLVFIVIVSTLSSACSSAKKNPDPAPGLSGLGTETPPQAQPPEAMGPPEPFGPPTPQNTPVPSTDYGPQPIQTRPVVLVFGPGLARSYAYAGVLRVLNEAKIPVGAIYGTEMGSLMGAIYSFKGTINSFEWALLRLKDDLFLSQSILSTIAKRPADGKKLEDALEQIFGTKSFSESKIKLKVVAENEKSKLPTLIEKGEIAQALRAAMGAPHFMTSSSLASGEEFRSSAAVRPFAVSEAKMLNLGPVVVVDLLEDLSVTENASDKERELSRQMIIARRTGSKDLEDADLVIRPELRGIGLLDFNKKTEIAFKGKSAALKNLNTIRRLVGLPVESEQSGSSP